MRVIDRAVYIVVCTAFLAAMLGTCSDVFMRYVFDSPIWGVVEINTLLVPVLVFLGISETQRQGGHIKVVVLTIRFAPRVQIALEILVFVLGFAFLFVVGFVSWKEAVHAYSIKQVLHGCFPPISTWWSKFVIPVGCWLFCVQYVRDIAHNSVRLWLRRGSPIGKV